MGERSADILAGSGGLSSHVYARYRVPNHEAFLHDGTIAYCTKAMTAWAKVLANRIMCGEKTLRVAS
jgi:hypothetical protein